MTMPHLMNCGHSYEGWCLDCVKEQYDEMERCKSLLERANRELMFSGLNAPLIVEITKALDPNNKSGE